MGNSRSSPHLETEQIEDISEETGFTRPQIERLYDRFRSLDKTQQGYLTREDFLRIPELAINPLGDRIVHAFFYESKHSGQEKVDFTVIFGQRRPSPLSYYCWSGLRTCGGSLQTCQEEPIEKQAQYQRGEASLRIPDVRPQW